MRSLWVFLSYILLLCPNIVGMMMLMIYYQCKLLVSIGSLLWNFSIPTKLPDPVKKVLYLQPFFAKKFKLLRFLESFWISVEWRKTQLCYARTKNSPFLWRSLELQSFWVIKIASQAHTNQVIWHTYTYQIITPAHTLD